MQKYNTLLVYAGICCLLLLLSPTLRADTIDLTTGPASPILYNGAYITFDPYGPSGTGVIDSFVRVKGKNNPVVEEGYNTSGRPVQYNENTSPQFTRNLQLGNIPLTQIGSAWYFEFLLDINEADNSSDKYLSLDNINIYASSVGSQTGLESSLGTLIWTLDPLPPDSVILMNYDLATGSGRPDMSLEIPISLFGITFDGTIANYSGPWTINSYLYLYSTFGGEGVVGTRDYGYSDGFEEWAVKKEGIRLPGGGPLPPVVPEPSSLLLIGTGLAGLGIAAWRNKRG